MAIEGDVIGNIEGDAAPTEVAEAEGAEVEVTVEGMGDGDDLRGSGGGGLVLEADGVGQGRGGEEPVFFTETLGSDDIVGVGGANDTGKRTRYWTLF